ncbi:MULTISPECIES: hybrid sensor histidine kinase/response regulator [Cyanophyceae]|uniref:hybrid sensor histidine kinase/response regulator n=1 Tax=Cyanophyceae TaxID=3028117 RepID=UPI0016839F76|nr:hybrid sensor histidine kinase/response regulator [Trichocoleus sp. FACHB-40]MBD2003037.1 hybrid sensor histidine kinase/response regulator [Trichocoleus sp. FACHB-40]
MTRILVIEDQEDLREIILEMLDNENFDALSAENGQVGIQLAQSYLPDLIICDVMMPELDGYGVLTNLRQNPATAMIPFIFLTAKASKADLRQGMELGADDYLTKPFTVKELLGAITARLEKKVAGDKQSQEKLDELRSNIVQSLPHELRTPLNGIMAFSQLLIESYDLMEKEEVLEMLSDINTSASRLNRLILNFLLYADLELIATKPERIQELRASQMNNPQKAIAEVARKIVQTAGREADLSLELQDAPLKISEANLKKIVEEIVDNACKFSATSTPIRVFSISENNTFTLGVSDQGRGMNVQQIANLGAYMQFNRKVYEQQGSGLGLILAKRLAELHGGQLTIQSIPNRQTTIHISLPISSNIAVLNDL